MVVVRRPCLSKNPIPEFGVLALFVTGDGLDVGLVSLLYRPWLPVNLSASRRAIRLSWRICASASEAMDDDDYGLMPLVL